MDLEFKFPVFVNHLSVQQDGYGELDCKACEYFLDYDFHGCYRQGEEFFVCGECCEKFNIKPNDWYCLGKNFVKNRCIACNKKNKRKIPVKTVIPCTSFRHYWLISGRGENFTMDWNPTSIATQIPLLQELAKIVASYLCLAVGQQQEKIIAHIFSDSEVCHVVMERRSNFWERWKYRNLPLATVEEVCKKFIIKHYTN